MVKEYDVDKSGTIEFKEFLMFIAKNIRQYEDQEELVEAFKVFSNGTGLISHK